MLRKLLLKLQNLLSPQKPQQPEKLSNGGLNLLQDSFKDSKNGERTGDTPFGKLDLSDIRVSEGVLKVLRLSTLFPILILIAFSAYRMFLDSQLKIATDTANLSALEINQYKNLRIEYEGVVATQKIYEDISKNKNTLYPKVNLIYTSLVPNVTIQNLTVDSDKTVVFVSSDGSLPFVYYLDRLLKDPLVSKVILDSAYIDKTTQKMLIGIQVKYTT